MTAFEIVNWEEVILWPVIGVTCPFFAAKAKKGGRTVDPFLWVLGPTFVIFGVSDYIELHTEAWWRPLSLFLLKAACVTVFVVAGVSD